jgi:hypothetical protein
VPATRPSGWPGPSSTRSFRLARKWSSNVLPNPVADTELPSWGPSERPKAVRSPKAAEVLALCRLPRWPRSGWP